MPAAARNPDVPRASHRLHLRSDRLTNEHRQNAYPIAIPLAATHTQLAPVEIDVLHPQLTTLLQSQARTVEELRHQLCHPLHLRQHAPDLGTRKNVGQRVRTLRRHQPRNMRNIRDENRPRSRLETELLLGRQS